MASLTYEGDPTATRHSDARDVLKGFPLLSCGPFGLIVSVGRFTRRCHRRSAPVRAEAGGPASSRSPPMNFGAQKEL